LRSQHRVLSVVFGVLVFVLSTDLYGLKQSGVLKENASIAYFQTGYTTLGLANISDKTTANSYRGGYNYFISEKVSIQLGYYSLTSLLSGKTLLSGFDGGTRIYLFSPNINQTLRSETLIIDTFSYVTHYLNLNFVQRTLSLGENQIGYSGYGLGYGLSLSLKTFFSWPLIEMYNLNVEVQTESFSAFGSPDGSVTNILAGIELVLK
jgi:hypothetical protein